MLDNNNRHFIAFGKRKYVLNKCDFFTYKLNWANFKQKLFVFVTKET